RIAQVLGHRYKLVADELSKIGAIGAKRSPNFFDRHLERFVEIQRASDGRDDVAYQGGALCRLAHLAIERRLANRDRPLLRHGLNELDLSVRPGVSGFATLGDQYRLRLALARANGRRNKRPDAPAFELSASFQSRRRLNVVDNK